jgi:hypothetical protein
MKTKHMILPFVIGAVASMLNELLISNLWAATLFWHRPVVEWLAEAGYKTLGYWSVSFYLRIPTFVIALLLGAGVARMFANRWVFAVCGCGLGLVGVSFLATAWFNAFSSHPSWGIVLKLQAWSLISIALLLLGAWSALLSRETAGGVHAPL